MLGGQIMTSYSPAVLSRSIFKIDPTMNHFRQRPQLRRIVAIVALTVSAASVVGACTPIGAAAGAGATAGTLSVQERGFKTGVQDTVILAKINQRWLEHDFDIFAKITAKVVEGRVLLTGTVPKTDNRIDAVRIAWQVEGVGEVLNEIEVSDQSDLLDVTRDAWVTTQLRIKLTVDGKIKAINYAIDTVNGVVYLMGIAQDSTELERVTGHARNLNYVRRIVSYVRLKNEAGTKAGST
jgi:osmotically-inducible protein OsmY